MRSGRPITLSVIDAGRTRPRTVKLRLQ